MTTKRKKYNKTQLPGKPEKMRVIDYLRKNFSREGFEWEHSSFQSSFQEWRLFYKMSAFYDVVLRYKHSNFPLQDWTYTVYVEENGERLPNFIPFEEKKFKERVEKVFEKYEQNKPKPKPDFVKEAQKLIDSTPALPLAKTQMSSLSGKEYSAYLKGIEQLIKDTGTRPRIEDISPPSTPPVRVIKEGDTSKYPKPVRQTQPSKTRQALSSIWSGLKAFIVNLQSIVR